MRRSLNKKRGSVGDRWRLFPVAEPREGWRRTTTRGARRNVGRSVAVTSHDATLEGTGEQNRDQHVETKR